MNRLLVVLVAVAPITISCSSNPPPDLPGGEVTVLVTRSDRPVAGATVVLHDATGAVLDSIVTGADGTAIGEVVAHGMVTVVDPIAPTSLITIADVAAGPDSIEIPLEAPVTVDPDEPAVGTLRIDEPPTPPPAGTDHLAIATGCGTFAADTLPVTVPITADCVAGSGEVPVVVTAWTPNRSLENPGQSLAFVAGTARVGAGTEYALAPGAWSTACAEVHVTTEPVMSVQLWPKLAGLSFLRSDPAFCELTQPATGYAYGVIDLGEGVTATSFTYVGGGDQRMAMSFTAYAAIPAAIEIAEDADLLIGDLDLASIDPGGAQWTSDPALADADAIVAALTWVLPDQVYVRWRFVVAGSATAVVRPQLPAAVVTWPALATATERIVELRLFDAPWVDGLAGVHHALPVLFDLAPRAPRQPPGTTLRMFGEKFYPDAGS